MIRKFTWALHPALDKIRNESWKLYVWFKSLSHTIRSMEMRESVRRAVDIIGWCVNGRQFCGRSIYATSYPEIWSGYLGG